MLGALTAVITLGCLAPVDAQWGGRRWRAPIRKPSEVERKGEFTFCRLQYTPVRREWLGTGWDTDYPDGDRNLPLRLSQLTRTDIARTSSGDPFHAVVSAEEVDLYDCPFLFASDVGTIGFSGSEIERLRDYLLKGGFLWVDDFWGEYAWQMWSTEIGKVLPGFRIVPVPSDHVLMNTLYSVDGIPKCRRFSFGDGAGAGEPPNGVPKARYRRCTASWTTRDGLWFS